MGALEIVKLFTSKDPKICRITLIDAQGWTPLHLAALKNHPYVIKYLLEQVSSWTQNGNDVFDNDDGDDNDDDDDDDDGSDDGVDMMMTMMMMAMMMTMMMMMMIKWRRSTNQMAMKDGDIYR